LIESSRFIEKPRLAFQGRRLQLLGHSSAIHALVLVIFLSSVWKSYVSLSADSYVLDIDEAPSIPDVFYQIMQTTHVSELEAEP
jgi:hypothetical protein